MTEAARALFKAPLLTTPFHARISALCKSGEWVRWGGYITVDCVTDVASEYFAIRGAATLFDISPMRKYRITGTDAERYMNRLVTRNIAKLSPGRVTYTVWCNDNGKVLDDGTVFRFGAKDFRLCSQEHQLCWLTDSARGFDVAIVDETEDVAGLALQGPSSCAVLKALGVSGIADLKPFAITEFDLEGSKVMVSRTGFTGDLGYELWVEPGKAELLWDRLMESSRQYRLVPIGSRALNMARIEAGFIQTNVDFVAAEAAVRSSRLRTPFELGLDWLVDFDKGHFTGRRALLAERQRGPRRRLVRLDIAGNKPAPDALIYHGRDTQVGMVTSAMWSPTLKRNIALAMLDTACAEKGTGLWAEIYTNRELKWNKTVAGCRIVDGPFFDPPRRRAVPAADR